jgi:hypothetical protein
MEASQYWRVGSILLGAAERHKTIFGGPMGLGFDLVTLEVLVYIT